MISLTLVYFISAIFVTTVNSYPQGAPTQTEACVNLQPVHRERQTQQRIPNRQEKAPYRVLLSQQYYVACQNLAICQQRPIQVIIRGIPNQQIPGAGGRGTPFRGFIIQARTPSGGTRAWGRFIPQQSRDFKTIACQNGPTLTHTINSDKQEVRFNWIPEPGMREQVQFVATIVQNLRTIYPLVYSDIAKPTTLISSGTTTKAGLSMILASFVMTLL
ncbi:uncharacterized protein LOC132545572 [Ylistrum balloti]|uniref:uncharacterized protein LOC132545572 n=1 Tax=Ylistrum balloti TaxID=509963 RepID=UPI002905E290|nr:uncharacterized protein LOC132545572 [Ylistrum balloti]